MEHPVNPKRDRQLDGSSDRRWVVLAEDGRFVILGRATDASGSEVARAEAALRQTGLAGWLAVMSGSIHVRRFPDVVMVHPVGQPSGAFDDAVLALRRAHCR